MSNRDRINLLPPGGSAQARFRWATAQRGLRGGQWEAVALIDGGGALVRHRVTGLLADWTFPGIIKAIHQRKAQSALAAMEAVQHDPT